MPRRHTNATLNPRGRSAPATPALARSEAAPVATDLPFRLEVDGVLAQMAAERQGAAREEAPGAPAAATESISATALISTTVPVAGMTCRTCEVRIQRFVGRLPNVEGVRASAIHGRVEIESSAPVPAAAIAKAIHAAGYEVGRTPWLAGDPAVWLTAVAGVALVAALAVVAQVTGLTELASGAGDLGNGGLLVALLLGLAAGVSTCMALVGGLVLALSASFQARRAATAIISTAVTCGGITTLAPRAPSAAPSTP
jgi:copper chaperone CopZ